MANASKKNFTICFVVFCVVLIVAINYFKQQLAPKVLVSNQERSKGSAAAPVKITEYMDFQCPACARGAIMIRQFMAAYPDKLFVEMKHFPLEQIHPHAVRSSRYAECSARQGKFWPMHDVLVDKQNDWKGMVNADVYFQQVAKDIKLDFWKLESCLTDDSIKNFIMAEKTEGEARGVQSTPTYFINNEMVVGTKSLEEKLTKLIGALPSKP